MIGKCSSNDGDDKPKQQTDADAYTKKRRDDSFNELDLGAV